MDTFLIWQVIFSRLPTYSAATAEAAHAGPVEIALYIVLGDFYL